MKLKPTPAEVRHFLRARTALLVHFSGAPKGAGVKRGHLFPKDLLHVIAGHANGGLSCSIVRPGDVFNGYARNAMGSVGVVLDPRTSRSLTAVDPHDCGSMEDADGNRNVPQERDITPRDLEDSLDRRPKGDYNEWVVRDFQVRGVFASSCPEVSELSVPEYPEEMPDDMRDSIPSPSFRKVAVEELFRTFRDLPLYSFSSTGIVRCRPDGSILINVAEIYPP